MKIRIVNGEKLWGARDNGIALETTHLSTEKAKKKTGILPQKERKGGIDLAHRER